MKPPADMTRAPSTPPHGPGEIPIDPAMTNTGRTARRRQLVEAGDVDSLLGEFDRPMIVATDREHLWSDVAEALKVASRGDPASFGLQEIDSMIALLALIRVRTERSLLQRLAAGDRAIAAQGYGPDPAIEDVVLEKLLDLYERQVKLIEARAAIERRTSLTRRSEKTGPSPAGNPEGRGGRRKESDIE